MIVMLNRTHCSRFALAAAGALLIAAATPALAATDLSAQPPGQSQSAGWPHSFAPLINRVKPAVVLVSTTEKRTMAKGEQEFQFQFPPGSPFGQLFRHFGVPNPNGAQGTLHALGSGFIVNPDGIIVTNGHVVKGATKIQVTLLDGTTLPAKVVGEDELTDLAVLKISADHPLPYVEFGDSNKAEVGDWVVSVGNPFGLDDTVTAGIISARGRDIHTGPYDDFLQIDAPINQGNSGGPTFNEEGKVIGINTAIFSPNGGGSVGIGFAIPSDRAKPVIAELEKSGKIVRGWLGVAVQPVRQDMEDALGVKNTNGALVAEVFDGGPAANAGVKPGDVITSFDGAAVHRTGDLTWAVANTPPGKSVSLTVLRDGKQLDETVTVVARKNNPEEQVSQAEGQGESGVGLKLQSLTPALRDNFDLPRGTQGAVVVGVEPNSPADQAGIQPGDLVEQVNRTKVENPHQVSEALAAARKEGKKSVALDIRRNGQDQFVVVELSGQS
jgi:serine protease Do